MPSPSSHPTSAHPLRLPGEQVMPQAPWVRLPSGAACIPQHYLRYAHDLTSVSAIAARVAFDDDTLVFASQDAHGVYIQIGLIGRENYDRGPQRRPRKLVYGRKWRIDSDTPTSEIIQTIYLAIKKAREHEVRELLTVIDAHTGATSAPLSSHQDLPLMAQNRDWLKAPGIAAGQHEGQIHRMLASLRFAERSLHLKSLHFFAGKAWLEITLGTIPAIRAEEGGLPDLEDPRLCVSFDPTQPHQLIHELMDALIQVSDRHVDETFTFDGFARFSRQIDPRATARLSLASRPYQRDRANKAFYTAFETANREVDAGRAPHIGVGPLAQRNSRLIQAIDGLLGHMPQGFTPLHPLSPVTGTPRQSGHLCLHTTFSSL